MTQPVTDWLLYRKCRICQRGTGNPCCTRSSRIVDGQPVGGPTDLERPHQARRLRAIRKTTT